MAKAAKQAEQSATDEQSIAQPYSERERLAMVLYTNLACTGLTTSKTPEHVASVAFDLADAFFAELETRRLPSPVAAVESASAAAPSPQGETNGQ